MPKQAPGTVRIIGGSFRGRRLKINAAEQLRPTPDRVRTTLFNWLDGLVTEGPVLDLFSGSGVLGLEALSRGLAPVFMVEHNRITAELLSAQCRNLQGAQIIHADALDYLAGCTTVFRLVFLDPPYRSDLLSRAMNLLLSRRLIDAESVVYAETPADTVLMVPGYEILRSAVYGQVRFSLCRIGRQVQLG